MANFGGILAGALGGLADVAGEQARRGMKEEFEQRVSDRNLANQERLMASRLMMEQRAEEYKQRQATMRAGEIDTDAQGILTGQKVKGVQEMYGDPSLTKDDLLPEELAMIDTNEVDSARARVTAAEKLGYLTEAKEGRGVLDTERRFESDKSRAESDSKRLDEQARKNDADAEYKRGLLDRQDRRESDRAGREKLIEVIDSNGSPRMVTREELNAAAPGEYKRPGAVRDESKRDSAEEARALTMIRQKEAQVSKLFGKDKAKAEGQLEFLVSQYEENYGKKLSGPAAANDPLGIRKAK